MKLRRKNNSELVLGAQAYRTSVKGKYGWEWAFHLLPNIVVKKHADHLTGTPIVSVAAEWLLWGAEVYGYVNKVIKVEE